MSGTLGTSILFDVFALNQSVARLLSEAMRDGPLSPAEYAVYSAIFELEAASPTVLAGRLGMRLTTFMDHLRGVMERGHARRLAHPADRRSYRVVLTASGLEAHRAANARFEAAHAAFSAALAATDPDADAAARRALAGMRAAAEAAVGAATEARVGVSPSRSGGPVG